MCGCLKMQDSENLSMANSGLSFMTNLSSQTSSLFSTRRGASSCTSFSIFLRRASAQLMRSNFSWNLLYRRRCMRQPCMYSLSILVPTRLVQPSSKTSCLVTNLYSSQTIFLCSSSSSSVMFSMQGTHLGADPSCGMKQQPTLGSSSAASTMPVFLATVNMLIEVSGSMLVKNSPSFLVTLICFLFEISNDLCMSSEKQMELIGSLQDDLILNSLRSNLKSQISTCPLVPTPSSSPVGSHLTQDTSRLPYACRLQIRLRSLKSQISTPASPPQASTFSFSLRESELMMLSVWKEVRNLPSSREILQTSGAEAETQRLALRGLYSRSRGQWGILVLQWAPYWAWKSMDLSCWAMTILEQSSERILNLTTSLSMPRRHLSDSSVVSQILIWGAQMPAATMQR